MSNVTVATTTDDGSPRNTEELVRFVKQKVALYLKNSEKIADLMADNAKLRERIAGTVADLRVTRRVIIEALRTLQRDHTERVFQDAPGCYEPVVQGVPAVVEVEIDGILVTVSVTEKAGDYDLAMTRKLL